ncbi:hypothetical protein Lpp228_05045 [Lacticaseibacillus paracasei subsp. paracasei Lpp228]|uniref:Uncharacterized protein n=1 Tax=Lacticaseibacillus paracasei subsp. paracasei Lpp7 TaxID=1256200 RepID=A0A8E0IGW1_LACPA|nr:hypothetical protein LCA32G_2532 [Lacticaseibacillus paracasei]EKQ10927.1 hypothetical protein LCAA2362_1668 [Lacticaseibacillus casei A2-362]EKQ22620.1 hypothetical protein LCAUW4_1018 [Lacticaseibacillus casei UW4]EPC29176.1 hypothetical protein Lpp46_0075 [Lacticaseibacillus paracasei subsp. paracasei Lpp46]EPC41634.1 hypothetical protein Lpp74_09911 [Lacticaseibacillus paracasei subsp. paracasei Lpp74]EPC46140.1 hypothetical protein Lpp219_05160 [Lacticaseibacillus paracasei subsp. para
MATWIIGGIVVLIIAVVAYRTFFKKIRLVVANVKKSDAR